MAEETRFIQIVGNYSMSQAYPEDCSRCKDASYSTVLIDGLYINCYVFCEKQKECVTVIETHGNNIEWGISFTGYNPEAKDYFKMADKDTAFRLKDYLNK